MRRRSVRVALAAALLLAGRAASAGPVMRLTPLSTPMSRPAALALRSFLTVDPSFAGALHTQPGLAAVLTLSPDRARDRQALGPLASRLPAYYDSTQLSIAMLSASAAAQEEVASRAQRAVRAVERGELSRRGLKSELASLEAYAIYGEPAADILQTTKLASARLAAGERTRRVAAALMAGIRDDLAGRPEEAVYGEYGRPPAAGADEALTRAMDARLQGLTGVLGQLGYPTTVDPVFRARLLESARAGSGSPLSAMHAAMDTAAERAVGALQERAYEPGTRFRLTLGADGELALRMAEFERPAPPPLDASGRTPERARQLLRLALGSRVNGIKAQEAVESGVRVVISHATQEWLLERFESRAQRSMELTPFIDLNLAMPLHEHLSQVEAGAVVEAVVDGGRLKFVRLR
jgi:hypothetical protein